MIKRERMSRSNNSPCILIVSEQDIVHVDLVVELLRKKKINFFRFNIEDFPQRVLLDLDPKNGRGKITYPNIRSLNLEDITSCWYYHSPVPKISSKITGKGNREFAIGETRATINGLWRLLDDRFWVNHPNKLFSGSLYKLKQLQVAKQIGLNVPKSHVTNDIKSALKFFDVCANGVILKMMGAPPEVRQIPHVFTTLLTRQDIEKNGQQIRLAPVLFQEFVPKKFELRITVVGGKIFPAALYTQDVLQPKMDWKQQKLSEFRHEKFDLPKEIHDKCLLLMHKLGLNYGAIDFIVTPDNKYIFLEVNPSGAWGWLENRLGFPISESMADLLIAGH